MADSAIARQLGVWPVRRVERLLEGAVVVAAVLTVPLIIAQEQEVPSTPEGRIVAVALMFTGVGLVATLSASIAAHFVENDVANREAREMADIVALSERLDKIEAALHALIRNRPSSDDDSGTDPGSTRG